MRVLDASISGFNREYPPNYLPEATQELHAVDGLVKVAEATDEYEIPTFYNDVSAEELKHRSTQAGELAILNYFEKKGMANIIEPQPEPQEPTISERSFSSFTDVIAEPVHETQAQSSVGSATSSAEKNVAEKKVIPGVFARLTSDGEPGDTTRAQALNSFTTKNEFDPAIFVETGAYPYAVRDLYLKSSDTSSLIKFLSKTLESEYGEAVYDDGNSFYDAPQEVMDAANLLFKRGESLIFDGRGINHYMPSETSSRLLADFKTEIDRFHTALVNSSEDLRKRHEPLLAVEPLNAYKVDKKPSITDRVIRSIALSLDEYISRKNRKKCTKDEISKAKLYRKLKAEKENIGTNAAQRGLTRVRNNWTKYSDKRASNKFYKPYLKIHKDHNLPSRVKENPETSKS